ncbi:tyrosine-type recombinase/integrase [uncultured Desulfobacter sp.]
MKKLCERAGVKPFGFHGIRHQTASILYHKGYDMSVIKA